MHLATMLGRSFSVVTTLARTMGQAEHLVQRYGFAAQCRSIYACEVPVLELDDPASDARKLVVDHCRRAVEHDEADAVVLGCAGMADFCHEVSEQVGVPVIDGVGAAARWSSPWSGSGCGPAPAASTRRRCPRSTGSGRTGTRGASCREPALRLAA